MIYFIFLASVTYYLVFHWRNRTESRLRKQLVNLSTYHVTLSLIQATCSLIYSLTCPLTMLPIEVSKSQDKDKN